MPTVEGFSVISPAVVRGMFLLINAIHFQVPANSERWATQAVKDTTGILWCDHHMPVPQPTAAHVEVHHSSSGLVCGGGNRCADHGPVKESVAPPQPHEIVVCLPFFSCLAFISEKQWA
jgi:hypothetical protein